MSAISTRCPAVTKVVACYVRVSTEGQNEAGQRAEIQQWLTGNAIDPESVRWYVDKRTGDNLDRTQFELLQQAIFNGQVGTVVLWRLDRLSRKIQDGLNVLCDWCDRGLRIVSVTQQIDFNGTVGKMLAAVLLGVAEMEQEARRDRQRAGIVEAKKRKVYIGRRPGSFKNKRGPMRALRMQNKGLTGTEIAKALGVGRNTVFRYLRVAKARAKAKDPSTTDA